MIGIPDHPDILRAERDGMPRETPVCPVCGQECEKMYTDTCGDVLGCDMCVKEDEPDERFYADGGGFPFDEWREDDD